MCVGGTAGKLFGAASLVLAVLGQASCSLCGDVVCDACPPALSLEVTDSATGDPVAGVSVYGADGYCEERPELGYTLCEVTLGVGTFDFTLTAEGYVNLPVDVTINPDSGDSCCSCGYNSLRRAVRMDPG